MLPNCETTVLRIPLEYATCAEAFPSRSVAVCFLEIEDPIPESLNPTPGKTDRDAWAFIRSYCQVAWRVGGLSKYKMNRRISTLKGILIGIMALVRLYNDYLVSLPTILNPL